MAVFKRKGGGRLFVTAVLVFCWWFRNNFNIATKVDKQTQGGGCLTTVFNNAERLCKFRGIGHSDQLFLFVVVGECALSNIPEGSRMSQKFLKRERGSIIAPTMNRVSVNQFQYIWFLNGRHVKRICSVDCKLLNQRWLYY